MKPAIIGVLATAAIACALFFALPRPPLRSQVSPVSRGIDAETLLSEGSLYGRSLVNKFGRCVGIDSAPLDIWDGCAGSATYTGFPTGDAETIEVIGGANDTAAGSGANEACIQGLDENWERVTECIATNGAAGATTTGLFRRVFRVVAAGNEAAITVRHSTTTANIFVVIQAGYGQSQVAVFTVPANHIGYIWYFGSQMNDNNANRMTLALWVREFGDKVKLNQQFLVTNISGPVYPPLYGALSYPEKTDIALRVVSETGAGAEMVGRFGIVLVQQ